jgi:hypothetical protein
VPWNGERLYAHPPGYAPEDDDAADRRAAEVERERAIDAYDEAQRRGRWIGPGGMSVDFHPHDAPPRLPPEPHAPGEDPTGRKRYQADHSPTVMLHLVCAAEGCEAPLTVWGREQSVAAERRAGGPRCPLHPLDPPASQAATQAEGGT